MKECILIRKKEKSDIYKDSAYKIEKKIFTQCKILTNLVKHTKYTLLNGAHLTGHINRHT